MIQKKLTIVNKLGLHARAAAKFVAHASRYSSDISVLRDKQRVNGKSIMGVMMLAANKGSELELHIEGVDEQAAFIALENLINDRFGEKD
jgi:phosphocarrier protein HPr